VNLGLLALTLYVLWRTLLQVKAYTCETKRLADAAIEQLPRPCVALVVESDSSDRALIEGLAVSIANVGTLRFKNIGTGSALNLVCHVGATEGSVDTVSVGGPPLAPGEAFDSAYNRNALDDPALIRVDYQSLGGARFRSEVTIEGRRWAKNFKFDRLPACVCSK
jgi:hypothetical protein